MAFDMIQQFSANFDARATGAKIDMLVLHYTGMESAEAASHRLCDPAAKVSAHYMIDEHGQIFALVDEDNRAWHAGLARWEEKTDINSCSIGIELVNPGHEFGYRDFPEPQMNALISLAHVILARHPIAAHRVLGHSDIAPLRKTDPGERFDWQALAAEGIGIFPPKLLIQNTGGQNTVSPDNTPFERDILLHEMKNFGYSIKKGQENDVICAFHRHFRPELLKKPPDSTDLAILNWLNAVKT
ncbi:MAG: N-acetylmuramoyl-L-alanine amidase [Alphaproteobacteria bacterium]|jgi:N-acetylmuramoyl-L-alanine amidase